MPRHPSVNCLCLACLLLLAGCRPAPARVDTPPPIHTPTPVSTPSPTPSVRPSDRPTPTLAQTATPTRVLETSTPTPDLTGTAIAAAVMTASQPKILKYDSPDGRWRVEIAIYDCVPISGSDGYAYDQMTLLRLPEGAESVVADQLQYCGGLGAFGLEGLFWSPNSRYFYYTTAREGVPDGGCGFFEPPIYRLEAANRQIEYLGGGPRSPDGSKIATWQDQDLVIWDVNAGEIARLPALTTNPGSPIAWSPDSQALVFLQLTSDCYPYPPGKSSVFRVDLATLEPALLLESEAPSFGRVAWDAPDRLRLFDENNQEWRYDFLTGELQAAP